MIWYGDSKKKKGGWGSIVDEWQQCVSKVLKYKR